MTRAISPAAGPTARTSSASPAARAPICSSSTTSASSRCAGPAPRERLDCELEAVEGDRGHGMPLARAEAELDRLAAALG